MFKTRRKIAEEEAKKDPNYIPTKDLKVDVSQLKDDEKPHNDIPWTGIFIFLGIAILVAVCIIVIVCVGGPVK